MSMDQKNGSGDAWGATGSNDAWGGGNADGFSVDGSGFKADSGDAAWDSGATANKSEFKADGGDADWTGGATAGKPDFGEDGGFGGDESGDKTCRNCGEVGHFSRECPEPRKFTGACHACGVEGHSKAECPQQTCRLCGTQGNHKAVDCKKRIIDYGSAKDMDAEAAWNAMKAADKERDIHEFREAFMAYAKAIAATEGGSDTFNLAEIEKTFRDEGMNAHLVANQVEVSDEYTIVDFQGNIDKNYVLGFGWSAKSRRAAFAQKTAESPEENLERLQDCGLVVDRGVPKCRRCGEFGHVVKHCTSEPEHTPEEPKCSNCGSTEHRYRNCPEEKVKKGGPMICKRCNGEGHKAADCTEPRSAENIECNRCGTMGHFSRDCTQERKMVCHNCDGDHMAKDCPKPRDYSRVTCRVCGEKGHTQARCSQKPNETAEAANGDGGWGGEASEPVQVPAGGDDSWAGPSTTADGW